VKTSTRNLRHLLATTTLAALLGAGAQDLRAQQGLSSESPFLAVPTQGPSGPAATGDLQLTGLSAFDGTPSACVVETGKKGRWLTQGVREGDLELLSCDIDGGRATVKVRGETRTLELKRPTPGLKPTPTMAVLASQQAQVQAPPPPPPPPGEQPAVSDIGPAGGKLPPLVPLTTREEQEREARMLVSDLMEIGMRQRKAYEEARKKAKEEAAAQKAASQPASQ